MHLHWKAYVVRAVCPFILLAAVALPAWAAGADSPELFRIRVHNAAGAPVEVSTNGGVSYVQVGKVVRQATALIRGFAASRWAPASAVAGVAVHGLRIKAREAPAAGGKGPGESLMLSIVPRQFLVPPRSYGGHRPGPSGIYTDIPCGDAIFRNLAPLVGNPVRVETGGRLAPLPPDYRPQAGDRLVILVLVPPVPPREIVFENWRGGLVTALFDGREPQPIARVVRPVLGVGRYDATSYTGVGRINTNHSGVITISTAGLPGPLLSEGEGSERRGGIQIEPAGHADSLAHNAPQVMVVEPLEGQGALEGRPPLFSGYIGLFWDRDAEARSVVAQVKLDNGPWEAMPEILGRCDDAFTAAALNRYFAARGVERQVSSGVTHLRLLLPRLDAQAVAEFVKGYPPSGGFGETRVAGVVSLNIATRNLPDPQRIAVVMVYVDGRLVAVTNTPPFHHELDTRRLANGPHEVELRALDHEGGILAQRKASIVVENPA